MQKFYVISDVHGYYDEMKVALNEAGFDPNNENHWLISCGDHLDRGDQPQEVIDYLTSLPRKILIKGNHEDLLMKCIEHGYFLSHDWSNGTAQTIIDLAPNAMLFEVCCAVAYEKVKDFVGSMVNYFETENYIFVHSWIPLIADDDLPPYYTKDRKFSMMDNWREATDKEWQDARWGNPFDMAEKGLMPDKHIVFGHWSCSDAWAQLEGRNKYDDNAKFDIFYDEGFTAVDACTALSKTVNVLVLEDNFMEEQNDSFLSKAFEG